MNPYLYVVFAMAVSMAIIPWMVRLAPRLGMIDEPDPRKVHTHSIPRVGGWGIALGTLLPLVLVLQSSPFIRSYLLAAFVLFVVGAIDDAVELGHYPKFIGQLLAVFIIVEYGGVWIHTPPYISAEMWNPVIGKIFAGFAILGMINATNHSDGLDGLAGGETLLSLIIVAFLALSTGASVEFLSLTAAAIGGILGFLRYNTHPAIVFMGDSGSTFLGFTIAVLVITLSQEIATSMSPAVVLLILGLPVIDILAVLAQRIYQKMNWFKATRNHIHHRLLDLNFDHYETVVIIYLIQAVMVVTGLLLRFESDYFLTFIYVFYCSVIFASLLVVNHYGWQAHQHGEETQVTMIVKSLKNSSGLNNSITWAITLLLPLYLIASVIDISRIPQDFSYTCAGLLGVLILDWIFVRRITFLTRAIVSITSIFVVYLEHYLGSNAILANHSDVFFVMLGALIVISLRLKIGSKFKTTPMDYLLAFGVVILAIFSSNLEHANAISYLIVKGMIVLYAGELLLNYSQRYLNILTVSCAVTLLIMSFGILD